MKRIMSVSNATVERLPLYYRCLDNLLSIENEDVISSKELGRRLGIQPTQVRKDLSYYGDFGRRGVGYDIRVLKKKIGEILGVNKMWPAVLIGAGNLGRAIVNYKGAREMGLNIVAVFDSDLNKIGNSIGLITVQSMKNLEEFMEREQIEVGIVAAPASVAQDITDKLVDLGIHGIWNFAPARLNVPEGVVLRNEELSIGIGSLIYHMTWQKEELNTSVK
ncbi:redox-sensing transcriptional repressor Rex [Natronospora cellulosivora (SeqCode)]